MTDMIRKDILPSVSKYLSEMCGRLASRKSLGLPGGYEEAEAAEISALMDSLKSACDSIESEIKSLPRDDEAAMYFCMNEARGYADKLETIVDRAFWPFPTYSELLFSEK